MEMWRRRGLTAGETGLGRSIFGDEIVWTRVRIVQAPALGFGAMVPIGRTIVFSRWRALEDFAHGAPPEQGWFVHELTHVWQAERGVFLAGAKLGALGAGAYRYALKPRFAEYNIERQAEIVRHLFLARCGAGEAGAPARDWLERTWAGR